MELSKIVKNVNANVQESWTLRNVRARPWVTMAKNYYEINITI